MIGKKNIFGVLALAVVIGAVTFGVKRNESSLDLPLVKSILEVDSKGALLPGRPVAAKANPVAEGLQQLPTVISQTGSEPDYRAKLHEVVADYKRYCPRVVEMGPAIEKSSRRKNELLSLILKEGRQEEALIRELTQVTFVQRALGLIRLSCETDQVLEKVKLGS